ncbi:hypothetical protein ACI6Q2_01175 [Chitinophagaceae bacterium LWZ2-11]
MALQLAVSLHTSMVMKNLYLSLLIISVSFATVTAQPKVPMPNVPSMRQLFHVNIDNAQKRIIKLSGNDSLFKPSKDLSVNQQLTQFLHLRIDNLQSSIELDSTLSDNDKFRWLRGIENVLNDFADQYSYRTIKGVLLGDVIMAYEDCMALDKKGESIYNIVANNELEVGLLLVDNFALRTNPGIQKSKDILVFKDCEKHPEDILRILSKHPDVPFADSLIKIEAYRNQEGIYNYAAAPNALGRRIQAVNDPLVKQISILSYLKNGRMYFPFIDKLYKKQLTMDSIAPIIENDEAYYKLLVQTEIEYAGRANMGDTAMAMNALTDKLRGKAVEVYINEINALHDSPSDAIRFKKIEKLTPQELYYLCVLGEVEIYTSSYLGVYKRIFERMNVPRSDSLLASLNQDHYKKFIKMAAAYNTLDDFLKKMNTNEADKLMRNFVNGLDKTSTLEEAVDVADSYASISDTAMRKLILQQVQTNLDDVRKRNNKRGETIYKLLNTVFLSMDTTNKIDISATLGIPPIYMMPNGLLKDTTGRIIVQQFFYGDKDGNNIFNAFVGNFSSGEWKITNKPEWIELKSVKGVPVTIYANKPLDTEKDLDAKAQSDLGDYLDSMGLEPTVVIHRGHSYYLSSTIKQLAPSAKLILLGSCGGYQSLNSVLTICPRAQIISSKQVGTGVINQGMINIIIEKLRSGQDLNWPVLWKGFGKSFTGAYKEKFDDYVPPHKNLGAIFIMAYNENIEKK